MVFLATVNSFPSLAGFSIVFGIICAVIAHNWGRSPLLWFFVGGITSCIGLIVLLCIGNQNRTHQAVSRPSRAEPPTTDTTTQWYYDNGGTPEGPVNLNSLNGLRSTGTISRDTLVWREGMKDWIPLGDINGS